MKKLIALAAVATTLALSGNVMAHGSKAKHGGIVQTAGDISFELVSKDGKATIYVDDHGKELPMAGASGTLTVLKGTQKTAVPLEAAGGNMLVAKGDTVLAKGSKAVAAITFADKNVVSVRFSVR
ncbi:hypothetical protein ACFSQU_14870 [Massilia sp. GCM10020059]|uniref:DUF5666 domain-containing protein n=1 Tax=Massilia agrisoli TaxID=2892444 RepID=A0ABS8ISB3_9BURK|nr:hypothetical protein [Massilia agrisoli]MCC6070816.1 hypothetical protein [Massilia agrisoli]